MFDLTAVAGQVMRDSQVIDQTHPLEASWEQPVFVNCDLGLTKQAIRILVDNAIKYTPAGGAVTMAVEEKDGMARLSVTDEGIGISQEALPHIFDRFYRADESRTRRPAAPASACPSPSGSWSATAAGWRWCPVRTWAPE